MYGNCTVKSNIPTFCIFILKHVEKQDEKSIKNKLYPHKPDSCKYNRSKKIK